jgi:hypothetical protein
MMHRFATLVRPTPAAPGDNPTPKMPGARLGRAAWTS